MAGVSAASIMSGVGPPLAGQHRVGDHLIPCLAMQASSRRSRWSAASVPRRSAALRTGLTALIDVPSYPAETEVPWFRTRVVCAKCGGRGNKIDVRPNWKEQPPGQSLTGKVFR